MADCILPEVLKGLRTAIKADGFTLRDLAVMANREDRIKYLAGKLGDLNIANRLNDEIEQSFIEPIQKAQMDKWARKAKAPQKTLLDKIRKLNKVLSPDEDTAYLESLVAQKLKIDIEQNDAKELIEKQQTADAKFEKFQNMLDKPWAEYTNSADWVEKLTEEQEAARMDFGRAVVDFRLKYAEILAKKSEDKKLETAFATLRTAILSVDAGHLRQLSRLMLANPFVGGKGWWAGAKAQWNTIFGKDKNRAYITAMAELYSRPNYVNGNYQRMKLPIGIQEEYFVGSLTNKIPGIGRLYEASDIGMTVSTSFARATMADAVIDVAGGNMEDVLRYDAGGVISALTGRWAWKGLSKEFMDKISIFALAFRWTASRIKAVTDLRFLLTPSTYTDKGVKGYLRRRLVISSMLNTVGLTTLAALMTAGIKALDDDNEETFWDLFYDAWNPLSSNFGKIVIGDTRIDITFGVASVMTLLSRLLTGKTRSATTGVTREADRAKLIGQWLTYRQSPTLSLAGTIYEQGRALLDPDYLPTDIVGNPQKWYEAFLESATPLVAQNAYDVIDKYGIVTGSMLTMADFFGIAVSDYGREGKAKIVEDFGRRSPMAQIPNSNKIAQTLKGDELESARKYYREGFLREANKLMDTKAFKESDVDTQNNQLQKIRNKWLSATKRKFNVD